MAAPTRLGSPTSRRSPARPAFCTSYPLGDCHQRRRATAVPTLDILSAPEVVVTREEVPYAKPNPYLFLAAARRLGVDIQESIVVGDSAWDMLAAQRARALGVGLMPGGYGREDSKVRLLVLGSRVRRPRKRPGGAGGGKTPRKRVTALSVATPLVAARSLAGWHELEVVR